MPWEKKTVMSEKEKFVSAAMLGEVSFSCLCKEYGISRKTGYKWINRAKNGESLEERSRSPFHCGNRTSPEMESLIVSCRMDHPAWGPRKLLRYLQNRGYQNLPCKSTVGNILNRFELISPEESDKHTAWQRFERSEPNELWQMDYKGDFAMLNGKRCYPLDITDDHSRYALCLQAQESYNFVSFQKVFKDVLLEYGLPNAILCDNGKPWGHSTGGITGFEIWMLQLHVLPIHCKPLHPQTQGKQERFHRTLKEELLKHRPMLDLQDAQTAFDEWRWCYNNERPHEALNMDCPIKHYKASKRRYPDVLREPEYDTGMTLRKVNCNGYISINRHRYYLAEVLQGKIVSIRDEDGLVIISYGDYDIANVDLREKHLFLTGIHYRKKV